jgi:hypothetical protein
MVAHEEGLEPETLYWERNEHTIEFYNFVVDDFSFRITYYPKMMIEVLRF